MKVLNQAAAVSDLGQRVELLKAAAQEALRAVPQNSVISESFRALIDATFSDAGIPLRSKPPTTGPA